MNASNGNGNGNGQHGTSASRAVPQRNELADVAYTFFSGVKRHYAKALVFYVTAMALLVGLLLIVPRKYMSEGKLFVGLGRGSVTLDPTATTGTNVHIQETREAEINSVADILESRVLAERVVNKIGLERFFETSFILKDLIKLPEIEFPSFAASNEEDGNSTGMTLKQLKRRETALRRFEDSLKVKPTKKAAIVSVVYRAPTPYLAQEIVDALLAEYEKLHIEAHRTEGSFDFFEDQLRVQKGELEAAQNALRDFKNEKGITSIEGQRASVQMQIDQIDGAVISEVSQLSGIRERYNSLLGQYNSLDEQLVTESTKGNANEGTDLMRDRLFNLEIRYKELLSRFHAGHPEVEMVKAAMDEARSVYNKEPFDRVEIKTAVNPTRLKIEEELLLAKSQLESMIAQRDALLKKRKELRNDLERLNADEAQLEVLSRNADVAKSSYRTYSEKMEEARISQELDRVQISNVKVVQPATLIVKPVSPKRALIAALGAIFFAGLALGLCYLLEMMDGSIRTVEDLTRQVQVPVLLNLPRSATRKALTGTGRTSVM